MYNRALADMGMGADPYTGNRYAFTAGNPISMVEMDGHFFDDLFNAAVSAVRQTVSAFSSTMSGASSASSVGAKAGAVGLATSMSANVLGFTAQPRELEQSQYDSNHPTFPRISTLHLRVPRKSGVDTTIRCGRVDAFPGGRLFTTMRSTSTIGPPECRHVLVTAGLMPLIRNSGKRH